MPFPGATRRHKDTDKRYLAGMRQTDHSIFCGLMQAAAAAWQGRDTEILRVRMNAAIKLVFECSFRCLISLVTILSCFHSQDDGSLFGAGLGGRASTGLPSSVFLGFTMSPRTRLHPAGCYATRWGRVTTALLTEIEPVLAMGL